MPCCLASLLSLWPAHEVLGWLCQSVIGASPGCCVSTYWPALGCMVMKAASVKNLGVQGDWHGQVWSSGSAGLLGWSFEPGTPLPVPEGSSWRPDWLSKTSPTRREPPALLSHPSQGWLAPCAGRSPSRAAGMCVPVRVSSRLLPSDTVWAGVTLSAAVALAKHHGQLHKRRWGG